MPDAPSKKEEQIKHPPANPQGPPIRLEDEWRNAKQGATNLKLCVAKAVGLPLSIEVIQASVQFVDNFIEQHRPESMRKKTPPTPKRKKRAARSRRPAPKSKGK